MPLVSTAHYYWWTHLMAEAAALMGRDDDAMYMRNRALLIASSFNDEFYNDSTHVYGSGSQCSNAIPLVMNIYLNETKQELVDSLVADIHRHGDRLTTGDVGNRYLFKALWENGEQELWYKLLNHYDVPGYGYQLKKGMTTLTEQWNPEHGASMNHFMMAHINNHLLQDIVGIKVCKGKLECIAPHPVGDLSWARGSTEIDGRKITVAWRIENGHCVIDADLPEYMKNVPIIYPE